MLFFISQVASLSYYLSTTVVHPTFFPYPLSLTLHAARVSIAYQNNVRASGNQGRLPWGTYLAGFLVMAWSGSFLTHSLLSAPPPQIYSIHPWINYLSVHFLLTALFPLCSSVLSTRLLDTTCPLIDAFLRLNSTTGALDLAQNHPDPRIQNSLFLRLILGAAACSGGGVTAATLGAWTPEWHLSTPVFLEGGFFSTMDVWGGALVSFVYGLLTASHPTYQHFLLSSGMMSDTGPMITRSQAHAAATILLTTLYVWRAISVHWLPAGREPKDGESTKEKQQ